MGKRFRFDRWKAAEEEKACKAEAERKAAHAARRLGQLQRLLREWQMIIAGQTRRREEGLVRAREVEGWIRQASRRLSREREGRERLFYRER
jgi:hypothetical protein